MKKILKINFPVNLSKSIIATKIKITIFVINIKNMFIENIHKIQSARNVLHNFILNEINMKY